MLSESDWDHINDMADAYANSNASSGMIPDLERKLVMACSQMAAGPACFDDFSALLDTSIRARGLVSRKIAWTAQHTFRARAWSVGQKILLNTGTGFTSPLIDQVARLGVEPSPAHLDRWHAFQAKRSFRVQTKIDALMVNLRERTIYIVKGASFSQVQSRSPGLVMAGSSTLFGPSDRPIAAISVDRAAVAALVLAHGVMKSAFNNMIVKPIYMVVDDPDCSWQYQAHDMSNVVMSALSKSDFSLDSCDVISSSVADLSSGRLNIDDLVLLPQHGERDPLHVAPVDRPSRSMMLLNVAWDLQRQSNELRAVPATQLANSVEERYGISYTDDLRRHDLEDCLRAQGFLRRARYSENSYAVTPVGVLRVYLMRAKLLGQSHPDIGAIALQHMTKQAARWMRYCGGHS